MPRPDFHLLVRYAIGLGDSLAAGQPHPQRLLLSQVDKNSELGPEWSYIVGVSKFALHVAKREGTELLERKRVQ
jgi:hypothetical protein